MVKPEFAFDELVRQTKATRQFTDRETPRDSFWKAIDFKTEHSDKHFVLNFYGVGGIGKSRLREELENILRTETELPFCTLNFESKNYREQGAALIQMCTELRKVTNIKFKNFALAYGVYWKKLQPLISLKEGSGLTSIFEEGDFITDVISAIEDAPYIGWIGKSIKFASSTWDKYLKDWWNNTGNTIVKTLESKTENEIAKYLPSCLAKDIKEYQKQYSMPIVIFLDTYEALWEVNRETGSFYRRDAWVRELIAHLPEVIWVILGREKVNWQEIDSTWNNILDQHLLENLSDTDIKSFLNSCNITDKKVQNFIAASSLGVPFYLDLAVDIYNEISETREITQEDFPIDDERLRERFLRYLNTSEKETLKILSVPNFWDISLFEVLVKEFQTQYPITAYNNLFRFSFINDVPNKPNTWSMHNLMREVLNYEFQKKSPELYNKAINIIFKHFNKRLMSSEKLNDLDLLMETFYFGKKALSKDDFDPWLDSFFSRFFYTRIPRKELASLMSRLDTPKNVIISLYGEPGVGKTTLVYECRKLLLEKNYYVLTLNSTPVLSSIGLLMLITRSLNSNYGGNFTDYNEIINNNLTKILLKPSIKEVDFLSIWVKELQHFMSEKQKKLIIIIDDFERLPKEVLDYIIQVNEDLPNVSWILSGRVSAYGVGIYRFMLRGFSKTDMKTYLKSLGTFGGGFNLQQIIDTIDEIIETLSV